MAMRLKLCEMHSFSTSTYARAHGRSYDTMADSGINDRLVKLRPLIDQTCFEFIDVSYFGAVNFLLQYVRIA